MERLGTKNAGFSAAAQVVLLDAYEYRLRNKENVVNWENFLGYREKLRPIVASDSGCELRPVHREGNKTVTGSRESISLVEGDVVGASFGSVRTFLRFAWLFATTT